MKINDKREDRDMNRFWKGERKSGAATPAYRMAGALPFFPTFPNEERRMSWLCFVIFSLETIVKSNWKRRFLFPEIVSFRRWLISSKLWKPLSGSVFLDNSSSNLCRITRTFISKSTNAYSRRSWKDWRRAFWAILDGRWEVKSS